MSFEEEFDKIIRQKVQQHDVPFDQSNWEKAQSMLDGQRTAVTAKKTVSMAKLLGFIGVGSVIAVSSYFLLNNKHTKQLASQNAASKEVSIQNKVEEQANTAPNEVAAKSNDFIAINANQNSNANTTSQISKPNHAQASSQKFYNQANQIASTESKIKTEPVAVQAQEQSQTPSLQVANQASAGELPQNNAFAKADNSTIASINESKIQQNQSDANVPHAMGQDDAQTQLNSTTDQANHSNDQVLEKSIAYTTSLNKLFEPLTPLGFQMLNEQDTMLKAETSQNIILRETNSLAKVKAKSHFFNIGLGANYNSGWAGIEGHDGQGINYFAQINYGFYLSRKLSLGAGIDFYNIQNIHQAYYTFQKTEYAFGSSNTYTSVIANNLKYLGVPLKLYFDLNASNILSFGILPSFLVASQNTVQMYQKLDGQKVNLTQSSNNLLYAGTAQKNIQISFGYKTKLSARFWIQGEAMVGLTDLFDNNNSNQVKQKPLGIRLGLQYHIFDK